MEEQLKNKFEEKYKSWKAYTNYIESNQEQLKEKQKDFSKRVVNITTKEQMEELFELQGEPGKHLSDHTNLSNDLVLLYSLFTDKSQFPKEVREDMEKLGTRKLYYIVTDGKLLKINEEIHEIAKEHFYQTMQNVLTLGK